MLNVNGNKLCQLCFSPIVQGSKICTHCSNVGNRTKYPVVLKEGVILAGRYSVGKVLGKGGFGVTYLCYDLVMNKKVAIKEFFPDSIACRTTESGTVSAMDNTKTQDFKNYAVKFYEEAKLVSKFNGNPNVISVYEFFYENDTAYFVMEALEGMDLKQYVQSKGGKIDIGEALFVTSKMLDALMVVHSAGVLHRDISPDNIYICKNGDIKLIDFGAARQVIGEESKSLSVILKQGFAPIEQYQKKGVQGPWTDIYALGATLYYILTGRQIDDAMSRMETSKLDMTGIPLALVHVLEKMLELKHNDRFQSVIELKSVISTLGIIPTPVSVQNLCNSCEQNENLGKTAGKEYSQSVLKLPKKSLMLNVDFKRMLVSVFLIVVVISATVIITLKVSTEDKNSVQFTNVANDEKTVSMTLPKTRHGVIGEMNLKNNYNKKMSLKERVETEIRELINANMLNDSISVGVLNNYTNEFYECKDVRVKYPSWGFYLPIYVAINCEYPLLHEYYSGIMSEDAGICNETANDAIDHMGGPAAITKYIHNLGYSNTIIGRRYGDTKSKIQNETTVEDAVAMLKRVYDDNESYNLKFSSEKYGVRFPYGAEVKAQIGTENIDKKNNFNIYALIRGEKSDFCIAILSKDGAYHTGIIDEIVEKVYNLMEKGE